MKYSLLLLLALPSTLWAQQPRIALTFVAEDSAHRSFADAARAYWQSDGARVIETMERISGLRFRDSAVTVIVAARAGSSGAGGNAASPLRADIRYPIPMTLIHELGHRLSHQLLVLDESAPMYSSMPAELNTGNAGLDGHKLLYLYLYDVWAALYGSAIADRWRDTERGWAALGFAFIKDAWDWADALGQDGRAAKLSSIRATRR